MPSRPSRFERPNADPLTRTDETFAFDPASEWRAPAWFQHIHVVLVETTNAVNIGGVVRAMANTGFERLRLVRPADFNPWDIIGVAHYTQHIVEHASVHDTLAAAIADGHFILGLTGKHHRVERNRLSLPHAIATLSERARDGETVLLVLGREDSGLSNTDLDACHAVATIPTNPAHPSLNLAQAALLVLYQVFQSAGGDQQPFRPTRHATAPADAALLAHLFADLERGLDAIDFLKLRSRDATLRSLRTALFRARLDAREAALVRAAFIEIRNFLRRKGVIDDIGPVGAHPAPDLTVSELTRLNEIRSAGGGPRLTPDDEPPPN